MFYWLVFIGKLPPGYHTKARLKKILRVAFRCYKLSCAKETKALGKINLIRTGAEWWKVGKRTRRTRVFRTSAGCGGQNPFHEKPACRPPLRRRRHFFRLDNRIRPQAEGHSVRNAGRKALRRKNARAVPRAQGNCLF